MAYGPRSCSPLLDKSRHDTRPSIDYTYKVLVRCALEGGELVTSHETDAVGFFAPRRPAGAGPRPSRPGRWGAWFELEANPGLPTDFD